MARHRDYHPTMRVYEVVMRSGAKNEVTAEVMHDDPALDDKIYFYRDKGLKQLVAYFSRDQVAGIILGPDNASAASRYK
jgi:hypothetical protein